MLKPKRKISRKELQRDPFLEFINDAQKWMSDKKTILYRLAIGIITVIAVVYFIGNSRSNSNTESDALLGKAFLSQDMGDLENARFQLQTLVDEYGGTNAGKEGLYFLGKMSFDSDSLKTAKEYLSEYTKKGDNKELLTASYTMLASIARNNGDDKSAEDYLVDGYGIAKGTVYEKEIALLYAEQLYINNKQDKALKIVDTILKDKEVLYSNKKKAEELKGKIEG